MAHWWWRARGVSVLARQEVAGIAACAAVATTTTATASTNTSAAELRAADNASGTAARADPEDAGIPTTTTIDAAARSLGHVATTNALDTADDASDAATEARITDRDAARSLGVAGREVG